MLTTYLTETNRLLQNPAATSALYSTSDLTAYINIARGQIAGESESIRVYAPMALLPSQQVYPFSAITLTGTPGVSGVFNVRGLTIGIASGQSWLRPRSFPYFQLYFLNNPETEVAAPIEYAQYGQGATGSLYFNPTPDQDYTAYLDCVCFPIPLVDDTTVEALPYPWTDCVPYFAAYMALMSAQRAPDADHMFQLYQTFAGRARQMSNSSVVPNQASQSGNPTRAGQLGVSQKGQ